MKDTKHIRQDFYSVAWVMSQGWDLGALGVPRGSKKFFFKHGHVAYQIDGNDEQNRMQEKIFILGSTIKMSFRWSVANDPTSSSNAGPYFFVAL